MHARVLVAAALILFAPTLLAADDKCSIVKYAEIPVTMQRLNPLITGRINGVEQTFIADSGGFYSLLTASAAKALRLSTHDAFGIGGLGGFTIAQSTSIKKFSLTGMVGDIDKIEFLVADFQLTDGIAGLIGQNILGQHDVEYDLANGVIRIFRSESCDNQSLAYWARNTFVASMDIDDRVKSDHFISIGQLNGSRLRVLFDSGAQRSFVSLRAAWRLGIAPGVDGVVADGVTVGIDGLAFPIWLARFDSLDLGGEQIRNARLSIGYSKMSNTDMLLGADFFLSHRIYISRQHKKIYFTHNGGPVFKHKAGDEGEPASLTEAVKKRELKFGIPKDAAAFRARAEREKRGFQWSAALQDLDEAIKLEPTAENFQLRASIGVILGTGEVARQDYDRAILLDPRNSNSYLGRAELRLLNKDPEGARADFKRGIEFAAKGDAALLRVADIYEQLELHTETINYLGEWIEKYPNHSDRSRVYGARCRVRALNQVDLQLALNDCDTALGREHSAELYNDRGLLFLRLGRFKEAMSDYEQSINRRTRDSWAYYGLGIAQLRSGQEKEGRKNIAAARSINSSVDEEFARLGIEP